MLIDFDKNGRGALCPFRFLLNFLPLLAAEACGEEDRGIDERGGEDDEREVALHLVAREREALDEQVTGEIARGDERETGERSARFFPAAEESGNTQRNKECQR